MTMYFHSFNDGWIDVPAYAPSLNIYTVGCEHGCKGCQAKDLQDFNHEDRKELTSKLIISHLSKIKGLYNSVCWLGGDPFYQLEPCIHISNELKKYDVTLKIVVYTGYIFPDLFEKMSNDLKQLFLNSIDFVIDGKWNGHVIGTDGCNQKIYKIKNNSYKEISYNEWKNGEHNNGK